jgi:hypothetical protein
VREPREIRKNRQVCNFAATLRGACRSRQCSIDSYCGSNRMPATLPSVVSAIRNSADPFSKFTS